MPTCRISILIPILLLLTFSSYAQKPVLVLFPVEVEEQDESSAEVFGSALQEGLQDQYVVYYGPSVEAELEIEYEKVDCNAERCQQNIAIAFNGELIADASAIRMGNGYILKLVIRNVITGEIIESKTYPCRKCDAFSVIEAFQNNLEIKSEPKASTQESDYIAWSIASERFDKTGWSRPEPMEAYLAQFPDGEHAAKALMHINSTLHQLAKNEWSKLDHSEGTSAHDTFLKKYQGRADGPEMNEIFTAIIQDKTRQENVEAQSKRCENNINECIAMVVIPSGTFEMGKKNDSDNPPHTVNIASFNMGKFEVSDLIWNIIMGKLKPDELSLYSDELSVLKRPGCTLCPAMYVSWNDVQIFIQRLNEQTGRRFRLPSESEWEYTARNPAPDFSVWAKRSNCGNCGSLWSGRLAPVGSLAANKFGLHDMRGNVAELVEDCWHASYNEGFFSSAPSDGSAWIKDGDCGMRVQRGNDYSSRSDLLPPTARDRRQVFLPDHSVGFRLAEDL